MSGKPVVWQYWEGPAPEYIKIGLSSVRRTCEQGDCEWRLVTPDNLNWWLNTGVLDENFRRLTCAAHRADCIRAALLAVHGGFYFDADTIGVKCPSSAVANSQLVHCVWENRPRRVLNGYVYACQGSMLASDWLSKINTALMVWKEGDQPPWTSFGEKVLTPLVDEYSTLPLLSRRPLQFDRRVFLPIDVDNNVRAFFEKSKPEQWTIPETVCWGLNHSWMMARRQDDMLLPLDQMRNSEMLIHRLIVDAADKNIQHFGSPYV